MTVTPLPSSQPKINLRVELHESPHSWTLITKTMDGTVVGAAAFGPIESLELVKQLIGVGKRIEVAGSA